MTNKKGIKNAGLLSGGLSYVPTNEPLQFSDKQYQYLESESKAFIQQYAKYSTDFVEAVAEGLNPNNPTETLKVRMRMSNIVKNSASTTKQIDDYKIILLESRKLCYIPAGTKFVTMGSTWLCVNSNNISNGDGSCIVQRCNAVWKHYDYYGNVLSEPICVESLLANANENDYEEGIAIPKGHFTVKCQSNQYTKQLDTNSRMILGTSAYRITGYSDFTQEFTEDEGSVKLLSFTIRKDEVNDVIDDLENKIANGKENKFSIYSSVSGPVRVGESVNIRTNFYKGDLKIFPTEDYPITFTYESLDENIAILDKSGNVTGVSVGETDVKVTLEQNPSVTFLLEIFVLSDDSNGEVKFIGEVPDALSAYQEATISAVMTTDDDANVTFSFSGADKDSYSTEIDGNSVTIKCWSWSENPLQVTASFGDKFETAFIKLEGI